MVEFGVLAVAAALMGRETDSEFGKVGFVIITTLLFCAGVLTAPWSEVF